jgi:hypothetical protein
MATYQMLNPHPNPLPMGEGATPPQIEAEFHSRWMKAHESHFRIW